MLLIPNYLKNGILLKDKRAATKTKTGVAKYALIYDILYRQVFSGPYQRFVPLNKTKNIIEQVHEGICDTHIDGRSLCHRNMTKGFHWPMMKHELE